MFNKYGVKFCGGCNPTFERGQVFKKIKEETSKHIFLESVKEDEIYDGLLVICGCNNCCVDIDDIQTKTEPIIMGSDNQYEEVVRKLLL